VSASREVGKLGTGAPRAPLEVHVDLSARIGAPWPTDKVRTALRWIVKQDGHPTRLDCVLDDRTSCVLLSTIRQVIKAGERMTWVERMRRISPRSIHKGMSSGETLYLDSPHSQTLLRGYDKCLGMQFMEREGWWEYGTWLKLEERMGRAYVSGQVLSCLEESDWLEFMIRTLRGYVDLRATTQDPRREEGV